MSNSRLNAIKLDEKELFKFEKVGEGTYASVYKSLYHHQLTALKIVKLFPSKTRPGFPRKQCFERFKKELVTLQILAKHNIPNIPEFFGYKIFYNEGYLLMSWCANGSYKDRFIANPITTISLKIQLQIIKEVLEALLYMFIAGYLHRDLKPENILIDENKHALLADFGLSGPKNKEDSCLGTALYFSQELLKFELDWKESEEKLSQDPSYKPSQPAKFKYTEKTESYSAGLTFWSVLARKEAFKKVATVPGLYDLLMEGEREEIPKNCPKPIGDMLLRCWDQDPDMRPGFGEMLGITNQAYFKCK